MQRDLRGGGKGIVLQQGGRSKEVTESFKLNGNPHESKGVERNRAQRAAGRLGKGNQGFLQIEDREETGVEQIVKQAERAWDEKQTGSQMKAISNWDVKAKRKRQSSNSRLDLCRYYRVLRKGRQNSLCWEKGGAEQRGSQNSAKNRCS